MKNVPWEVVGALGGAGIGLLVFPGARGGLITPATLFLGLLGYAAGGKYGTYRKAEAIKKIMLPFEKLKLL